jgi:hypothetical protein
MRASPNPVTDDLIRTGKFGHTYYSQGKEGKDRSDTATS